MEPFDILAVNVHSESAGNPVFSCTFVSEDIAGTCNKLENPFLQEVCKLTVELSGTVGSTPMLIVG